MADTTPLQNTDMAEKLESLAQQMSLIAQRIRNNESVPDIFAKEGPKFATSANEILNAVTGPHEQLMQSMITLARISALRLFVKWSVFENIPPSGTISYEALAAKVGAETPLITRFAWILVSTGLLKQIGTDQVGHTETSKAFMTSNPITSLVEVGFDTHLLALVHMIEYFDEYGLKEPSGRYHTPFAYACGNPNVTVWEHMHKDPARLASFMTSMVAMASQFPIVGPYDFSWLLQSASDSERPLVVDVGGGKGHALAAILKATPGLPASLCVVEDLPEVVEAAKKEASGVLAEAQYVAADFHTQQPVKGALIYYIRLVLHDYGDKDSVEILQHIQQAMAPDSRLLIVDEVLSNPPSALASAGDIFMATINGKERTLENFMSIASQAGLSVVETHYCAGSTMALIECKKV